MPAAIAAVPKSATAGFRPPASSHLLFAVVLFTDSAAANTHVTTLAQIKAMLARGEVITVPLNGPSETPNQDVPVLGCARF